MSPACSSGSRSPVKPKAGQGETDVMPTRSRSFGRTPPPLHKFGGVLCTKNALNQWCAIESRPAVKKHQFWDGAKFVDTLPEQEDTLPVKVKSAAQAAKTFDGVPCFQNNAGEWYASEKCVSEKGINVWKGYVRCGDSNQGYRFVVPFLTRRLAVEPDQPSALQS